MGESCPALEAWKPDPEVYYSEHYLLSLGYTEGALRRARKNGLRCKEPSRGLRQYKGEWLRKWLDSDEPEGVAS